MYSRAIILLIFIFFNFYLYTFSPVSQNNTIILKKNILINVNADGSFQKKKILIIKILTEDGKKIYLNKFFKFNKNFSSFKIQEVKIRKPNNKIIILPKSRILDGLKYESNIKTILVNAIELEVGDVIEYRLLYNYSAFFKNKFSQYFLIQDRATILDLLIKIRVPKKIHLYSKVYNGYMKYIYYEKNANNIHKWEGKNIPNVDIKLSNGIRIDNNLKLIVSTFNSWRDISSSYAKMSENKIGFNREMKETVKALIENKNNEKDKISSIFHFVSSKIKYTRNRNLDKKMFDLKSAKNTFFQKNGMCRDKSLLLISMLKLAGIFSEEVLLNIDCRTEKEIPIPFFQHSIVAVKLKNGDFIYMDPTLGVGTSYGDSYIAGRYILHIGMKGKDLFKKHFKLATDNLGKIFIHTAISSNGVQNTNIRIFGAGTYDLILRQIGKKLSGQSFIDIWVKQLKDLSSKFKVIDYKISNPLNVNNPFKIEFEIESTIPIKKIGSHYYLKMINSNIGLDLIFFQILKEKTLFENPLINRRILSTIGSDIIEEIVLPRDYKPISIPKPITFYEPPFSLKIDVNIYQNKLIFKKYIRINTIDISKNHYNKLRKLFFLLKNYKKSVLIIEK